MSLVTAMGVRSNRGRWLAQSDRAASLIGQRDRNAPTNGCRPSPADRDHDSARPPHAGTVPAVEMIESIALEAVSSRADPHEEGQPYFVMESVDGQRIDEYCDSRRLDVPAG